MTTTRFDSREQSPHKGTHTLRARARRRRALVAASALAAVGVVPLALDGSRADASNNELPRTIELPQAIPGDANKTSSAPEGIAYGSGRIFVSSRTSGAIFIAKPKDKTAEIFLPAGSDGRTAATGMKVANGRLFISGAGTGKIFIYKTNGTYEFDAMVADPAPTLANPSFINDVAVGPDGSAYFTDSFRPVLYRAYREHGDWKVEKFMSFVGTPLVYGAGFNANGIVVRPDGAYALVVSQRSLYRINLATKEVIQVQPAGGIPGDGLLLTENGDLLAVGGGANTLRRYALAPDWTTATLIATAPNTAFVSGTTVAVKEDTAFVVNAQFPNPATPNIPTFPYWVSVLPVPVP